MTTLTLLSPAKLNLYLRVLNKRPDGYHNLVTLFERINLFDTLKFTLRTDGKIHVFCRSKGVPRGPRNLVYQVAQRLQKDFDLKQGVTIEIKKKIPVAAGLGGGSGNAATTLMGLNRLWGLSLSKTRLVAYAKGIGADVPFFVYDCPWALGTERGDKIRPLTLRCRLWQVLVVPVFKMYTKDVFHHLAFARQRMAEAGPKGGRGPLRENRNPLGDTNMLTKGSDNVNILIRHLREKNFVEVGRRLRNDLEESAFSLSARLKRLKETVGQLNTLGTSLSGSGPSIFGLTHSQKEAEYLRGVLLKRYKQVFVVATY